MTGPRTALVLFTRDLRISDQPALSAATRTAERVAPLFVLDEAIEGAGFAVPNRRAFLAESLADLHAGLAERGGGLVLRRGDVVEQALRLARHVGARALHLSDDASAYAAARLRRLRREAGPEIEVVVHPGVTVVPPGELRPTGGDHYRVFTPYWRAWSAAAWRPQARAPHRIALPKGLAPSLEAVGPAVKGGSPERPHGGERAAERVLRRFLDRRLGDYPAASDMLARPGTSELSPHLHFGTVSPRRAAGLALGRGDQEFVRQLCWRDFHHQVLRAFPELPRRDYRERERRWATDERALEAWRTGRTGMPIVDAGMRQLASEGWMHNRGRMITAAFLTKQLGIHWRHGAEVFLDLLVDGDLANNSGNWQWVAGTGNDTRPNRTFNPLRQARRFDPDGEYVRRHVPELAGLAGREVHEPWRLGAGGLRRLGYPELVLPAHAPDGTSTIPGL